MLKKVSLLCIAISLSVSVQILYADGNSGTAVPAGLRNLNPDPNGKPWLVGKPLIVTPEVQKKLNSIPELSFPRQKRLGKMALPQYSYNFSYPEFPAVFAQKGGSCGQAGGIGYNYTYEVNLLRGTASVDSMDQSAYGYTYDFLNGGDRSNGSWYFEGWAIAKRTGVVSVKDFGSRDGGLNGTRWMNGYAAYYDANFFRTDTIFKISVRDSIGLKTFKQWMYDHGTGDEKGGVANFSWFPNFTYKTIPAASSQAGKKIVTAATGDYNTDHTMTFAGYDDRIYCDLNGNGSIGNDERGAVCLVNSWGPWWGDSGRVWVPYKFLSSSNGIWNNQVYVVKVKKFVPKLLYKITMTHPSRSNIRIISGYASSITASSATDTTSYDEAFNYCGGSLPFEGEGGKPTIEFGLDVTDFYAKMVPGAGAKFFLIIKSNGGSGTVNSFSVMDYTNPLSVRETKCAGTNVAVSSGTTTLTIIYNKPGVYSSAPAASPVKPAIAMKKDAAGYEVFLPYAGKSIVTVTDLKGRTLRVLEMDGSGWHPLTTNIRAGLSIVTITSGGQTCSVKIMGERVSGLTAGHRTNIF